MTSQSQSQTLSGLRLLFLRILAILGIAIGGIGIVPVVLVSLQQGIPFFPRVLGPIFVVVLCSLWLIMTNRGSIQAATYGLLLTLTAATLVPPPALVVVSVVTVLAAAVLGNRVQFLVVNALVLIRFAFVAVGVAEANPGNLAILGSEIMAPLIVLTIVSLGTRYFVFNAERTARRSIRSAQLLQSTAEVAQATSQILELQPLLESAIKTISQRFGFYHVQVFLLDDARENAVLVASTGTVGRLLLDRKHRLAVGSRSVIGRVTSVGQPVIARDSDPNNVRYRNELLPETRAELALPIRDGDTIIGALDVQSRNEAEIDDNVVQALQVLSNLLATAIRNSRLFEQQSATARENAALYGQTRDNLDEIQRLNRELTGQAWRDFLNESQAASGVTLEDDDLRMEAEWTRLMQQAGEGRMVYEPYAGGTRVALPLVLRGAIIGAVEFDTRDALSLEALAGARAILDRLTVSLENARLYEAAQSSTAQEARLNQISARYGSASSIDELLDITLHELSSTLGAERGTVRLSSSAPVYETHQNGGGAS
jgi:GAF domain-containing protein